MATFYTRERAKYGNVTGQIIIWPVNYTGTPDSTANIKTLPAGYLKCDGTKYYAVDYPQLAAICGTGSNCKFIRKNLDGTNIDTVTDTQFMVPDLGSKYAEPTTGANAGVYNSIRVKNKSDNEVSRSGIAIEAEAAIGTTVQLTYSGTINIPSQEIPVRGKPSWSYAGTSHRVDSEGVEDLGLHPHMHFSNTNLCRNYSMYPEVTDNDLPAVNGSTGRQNGSTIDLQEWLEATRISGDTDPTSAGSGQKPCLLMDPWDPNDGTNPPSEGTPIFNGTGTRTGYFGGCIGENDPNTSSSQYFKGSGSGWEFGCLSNQSWSYDRRQSKGTPETTPAQYITRNSVLCWLPPNISGSASQDAVGTVPYTFIQGEPNVPVDFAGASLADTGYIANAASRTAVVPLQSNQDVADDNVITEVRNEIYDTADLSRDANNTDPTIHNHRIDIVKGDHSYKVKTNALTIQPDNLVTTMTIGEDSSASIDSGTSPFIVMEYLIKV